MQLAPSDGFNSPSLPPLYRYLAADCIRLLCHKTVDGTSDIWWLETFERRTAPPYDALSYCWGTDVKQPPLVCNGRCVKVTSSAAGALQMIARRHTQADAYCCWVDAICLNQDDEDEKAVHVARMSAIYAEARQAVVWLGEADSESDSAIANIRRILPILKSREQHGRMLENREIVDLGLPRRRHSTWYSIGRLLYRPWFSASGRFRRLRLRKNLSSIVERRLSTGPHFRTLSISYERLAYSSMA